MKKKQKRNINIGDSEDKNNNNNIMIKEKVNEEKSLKQYKMTKSNINTKIQSIRNNAVEKMKFISTSNDKYLKPANTESLFKTKKINNYQPISSKASSNNNNNPFRSSSNGCKDNINIKKNIPSIKKLFTSNISNSFTAKERILNKSKNEEISSYPNIPQTNKNKSRKKDKIILKNKNLYNLIEKTVSINDYSVNITDIKSKEISFDDKCYKYSQQNNINKKDTSKPKKKKNLYIKLIEKNEKKNEIKNIKDTDIKKATSNNKIGTDYNKDNKKTKIRINNNNKEIINEENKIINNSSIVKKDDINLIITKKDKSNKNSLKNIKQTKEKIEETSRENESISEKEADKNDKSDEMKVNENMKSNGIEKENNILKDSLNNDNNNIDDNVKKSEDINNNNNIIDEDKDNKEAKNHKMVDYYNLIKSNDFKIIDNYNNNEFNKEEEIIENEIIDLEEVPIAQKKLEEKYDVKGMNEYNNKDNNENENKNNKDNNEDNNRGNNGYINKDNNIEYNNDYNKDKIGLNGNEENYDEDEIVSTKYLEIEEKIRKKENIITYFNHKKNKEKEGKSKFSNEIIKVKAEDNLLNNGMNTINNYLNEKDINYNPNGNLEALYNKNYNNENAEKNHIINENNLNGNNNPNENKEYYFEKKDIKNKSNSKNNGVEIIEYDNNEENNNENKLNEFNSNQNRIKPKYEVIEISVNETKGKKAKPKLKEKKEKNENNIPQTPTSVISSQELSPSNNLIDIQNLIIKSKQKVANDLDKIEKKGQNSKIINIPIKKNNKNQNQKEVKIKKNNSQKDILDRNNNRKKVEESIKNNLNIINKKTPLNKRYNTDLSVNKRKNKKLSQSKSKSKSKSKNKNLNSINESRYKKENEIISKKLSSQIIIKKNYMTNLLDNNKNELKNNEKDKGSPQRPKKESTSQKKNKRSTKYDNIDLNTFFTKSSKKEEKKAYNKQNVNIINTKFKEENGGIFNEYENNIIKEEDQEQEIDNNFGNKKETRKIIISPKKKDKVKEEEINEEVEDKDEKDKNELINLNKELINRITLLKKEVEYSKKEMRKKDEKILRYLNRFDKIASENAYNNAEILNLEEELMNRKNEMDLKTKKINELININIGLEQEVNQLKTHYKLKANNKNLKNKNDYINSNETEYKTNNKKDGNFNNKENDEETINKYEEIEEQCNFEELNIEQLHSKRNSLIKKRNQINALYNKLPIKIVDDETIEQKIQLENKLKKINNDLVKIRLQLKNISQ